ncbi:PF14385 domain protein [Leptospira yanagawae serovar Saopaulo str. Sao Paulo = ATCC 700523]|uniref:PF14385 domain protein n=1 Tax=Leptospira yanagawae serovar Saopaulo str. Sao Paulo = ATCC 700523 TaxID=1249483 RepID=A0A5E8HBG7_9LEPT|nr:DUF4416 family protein [Leptospira yanagawae]EOQ88078.1 PF14385 domain protein [Leptospira yanagawae serovar Saopaulo str. Sao Paulo = ATCC 700523]
MPQEILERPAGASFFLILSYENEDTFFELKNLAEKRFSKIMYESVILPKWVSDETEREFSYPGRYTKVLSFKQRIHREEIVEKKKECLEFQSLLQKKDLSTLLIPGYVTSHNIVIAKSKDDFHRMYLFQGVYAETVYYFSRGQLTPLPYAQSYFKEKDVIYFFNTLRESYEFNKFKS